MARNRRPSSITAMHEVSLVAELIGECERRSAGQPVRLVRVRHASSIAEPALRQAFRMLTEGSSMADATLEAEMFEVVSRCDAGSWAPSGMMT